MDEGGEIYDVDKITLDEIDDGIDHAVDKLERLIKLREAMADQTHVVFRNSSLNTTPCSESKLRRRPAETNLERR